MSNQQKEPSASVGPPGTYASAESPNQRAKEDPPSSNPMNSDLAVPTQASSGSTPSLYPNLKPLFQESGGSSIKTSTTNGSIHSGTKSSQNQDRPVGGASTRSLSTEELVNRLPISDEDKEKIKAVLIRKEISIKEKSGIVNVESEESSHHRDSPSRDENTVPSNMTENENSDKHFRPTGTGSKQLERWLFEVNSAIAISMGRWKLNADEKSLVTTRPQIQHFSSMEGYNSSENASDAKRPNLSPIKTQNLFPSNRQDSLPTNDDSPRKLHAFTPIREKPATPLMNQDFFLAQEQEFATLVKNWQNSSSVGKSESEPDWASAKVSPEQPDTTTDATQHDISYTENYDPEPVKVNTISNKVTKQSRNNSKQIMESIEGKYKNLRDNLIESRTSTEDYLGDRDTTFDSRGSTFCETIDSIVSSEHEPKATRKMDYTDIRDHFSLGILSTRTSGIVSIPSWDSTASYDSDASEQLFPMRGCTRGFPGTRGCGLPTFLCRYED